MPNVTIPLSLDHAVTPLDATPGTEIVVRGSFLSSTDGSTVDAATTTWPNGAPGGASVDAGGLVDFAAGGLHVTSRDPATHEVHAVVTSDPGTACAAAHVASPCLPLRTVPLARSRLLTTADWSKSLKGGISVSLPEPPLPPVEPPSPWLARTAGIALVGALAVTALVVIRRRGQTPAARLAALARSVQRKAKSADPVIAAPLTPALDRALEALRAGHVTATSREGQRLRAMLENVDRRLDTARARARQEGEERVADELVHEVEAALDAADEAMGLDRR